MVPDHLPEVLYRVRHGMLGDYEVAQSPEAVQPRGVDIIAAILARLGRQVHPTALDGEDGAAVLDRVHLLHGGCNVYVFRLELYDVLVLLLQVGSAVLQLLHLLGHQIGLPRGDGLHQSVVQEYVLLLGLHQEVPLSTNVTQKAKDVDDVLLLDLLEHGVQDDVCASATDASAKKK